MNTEHLKTLVDLSGKHAHDVLLGLQKPLMPTWLYIDGQGEAHVIGTPWQDEIEKRFYGWYMRTELQMHQATAYSFVSEAWAATAEKGWEPGQPHLEPRLDPSRREIVLAFATDGEQIEWRQWNIVRDYHERVTKLEEIPGQHGHVSWMTKLLKKHA